jgi:hypothetical protein
MQIQGANERVGLKFKYGNCRTDNTDKKFNCSKRDENIVVEKPKYIWIHPFSIATARNNHVLKSNAVRKTRLDMFYKLERLAGSILCLHHFSASSALSDRKNFAARRKAGKTRKITVITLWSDSA